MVRALILKGRQQGCSTYTEGRYFKKTIWTPNTSAYILSHEATSTDNLFSMVDRFYHNLPPSLQPALETANKRELVFENRSQYRVGTAGAKTTGRSQTNQLFHGSEVAFYENAGDIQAGVIQTVADVPGTEVILESTANGVGNFFYEKCMDAIQGRGQYILIFIPWYWQQEYRRELPPGFEFSDEECDIQEVYGLDDEQLYWRHIKMVDLGERLFKQEYPFTPEEAFQSSGDSLVDPLKVQMAVRTEIEEEVAPLVLGVDPARRGDRTALVFRRGRKVLGYEVYDNMDQVRLANIIARHIQKRDVQMCFIDEGMGYGTIDVLNDLGFSRYTCGVSFGGGVSREDVYLNKRAEMAGEVEDWFDGGGVSIPDDPALVTDILAIPGWEFSSSGKKKLKSKDKIREEYGKSPDLFDALSLTFAYPVASQIQQVRMPPSTKSSRGGSPLHTLRKRRRMEHNKVKGQEVSVRWVPY